jgi:hypothetical protein
MGGEIIENPEKSNAGKFCRPERILAVMTAEASLV